jgi:ATP-dependent RNA helicase DDX52/ROK1
VLIRRNLGSVRHLIFDEADRMLDQEFITQVQEVLAACTHETLQTAVFSATLPAGAERIALDMLWDPIRVVVGLKYVHTLFGTPTRSEILGPG